MAAEADGGDGSAAGAASGSLPAADGGGDAAGLEFGWVPAQVVHSLLQEVGNFRARAAAIELLHAAVLETAAREPGAVLPTLSALLAFLLRLVADANFKIAISAMTILEDLAGALGADVQPYLGTVAAPLIERLGDNVQMVRQAAAHAVSALARALGPVPVLAALGGALVHQSWRVREEGVNAHTAALLAFPKETLDYPACVRALAGAAADESPRVAAAALEAFALLHARLGALLQGLLTAVGAPEGVKRAVADRLARTPQLGLPTLDAQGCVVHQAHARPPSAQRSKPQPATSAAPAAAARPQQPAAVPGPAASSPARAAGMAPAQAACEPLQLTGAALAPPPALIAAAVPALALPVDMGSQRAQPWAPAGASAASSPNAACCSPGRGPWGGGQHAFTGSNSPGGGGFAAAPEGAFYLPAGAMALPAAAYVEFSGPSMPASSAASCASLASMAGGDAAGQQMQRSDGSLLSWQRPPRRPNQMSFTGPPSGRGGAGGAPGFAAVEGFPAGPGSIGIAEQQQQQQQQHAARGSMLSFTRPAKPAAGSAGSQRTGAPAVQASAPSASSMRRSVAGLPQQQPSRQQQNGAGAGVAAQPPPGAAAAAAQAAGAYNADLYSSVRNWQRQREDSGASFASSDGTVDSAALLEALSAGGSEAGQLGGAGQDMGLAPRSDSLLQWRLPKRASASQPAQSPAKQPVPAAAAAVAAPAAVVAPAPAAAGQPLPTRIGSATLKRAFTSVKKRIFGGEAAPGEPAVDGLGQEQVQPDSPSRQAGEAAGWSIAAVRQAQNAAGADQQQQQQQQCQKVQPMVQERGLLPRPGLSVVLPGAPSLQPAGLEQVQQQAAAGPDSPGKSGDRLSRLKQMSERRRVWSAPSTGQHRLQQVDEFAGQAGPDSAGLDPALTPLPRSPGADAALAIQAQPLPADGGSPGGSPGARPGLQALKARARTARVLCTGSMLAPPTTAGGSLGGSYQAYSMEAVNDVFGPDQALGRTWAVGSGTSLWSPVKAPAGGGTGSSSTSGGTGGLLRPLTVARVKAGGGSQWPDSPTSASSPTGLAAWRASGPAPDSPSAASIDSPTSAGGDGFSPASETGPLAQPEAALQQALAALQAAAACQKKELDWQAQYEALRTVRRLAAHHPAVVAPAAVLHGLVSLAAPVVDALRSTLSRLAIAVFQALAESLGPVLDGELDGFVPLLLKRAGQISISGRDNFLAVEADRALAAVVAHAGEVRVAACLLGCLASKSPDVRAKAAMHLDACLQQHGGRLVSSGGGLLPRLLRAAVGLLDEGGLEARTAGKRIVWELRRMLDGAAAGGGGEDFKRVLNRLDCKTDKVWEVLESGRMPGPPARLPSAGLHPQSFSGPPSPTAPSFSPAKPGILSSSGGPAVSPSRGGTAAGSTPSLLGSSMPARLATAGSSSGASLGARTAAAPQPGPSQSGSKRLPTRPGTMSGAGNASAGGSMAGGSPAGAKRGVSRPPSAGMAGPAPTGSLAGLDSDLQQRLEAAQGQLGSSEWKVRLEGLAAVEAAAGRRAGDLPAEAQLWLAAELSQRVVDANLKVQQQALAILNTVLQSCGPGLTPAGPALLPAICKCLDSGNPSVRQASGEALSAVVQSWAADAHLPLLTANLGSQTGSVRGKQALLESLVALAGPLWQSRPVLLRQHLLPAVFQLLASGKRPELRQLAQGALPDLGRLMGRELMSAAAASPLLAPAQQQLVEAAVAAGRGG